MPGVGLASLNKMPIALVFGLHTHRSLLSFLLLRSPLYIFAFEIDNFWVEMGELEFAFIICLNRLEIGAFYAFAGIVLFSWAFDIRW